MTLELKPGLRHRLAYKVPSSKTVAQVFDDSPEFAEMPQVFATAFLVGLVERACIEAMRPHLDWPSEQTVGTHVNISHSAPTPPGRTVTVEVKLNAVDDRRLLFEIAAHDGVHEISRGTHERFIIDVKRFTARLSNS